MNDDVSLVMNSKGPRAMEAQLGSAEQVCARQGAQLTELRRRVLALMLEAEGPLTAYQLLDRLKVTRKGAVPPTIYRALDFLMEQGLIHKVERLNAFIPCTEAGRQHPVQLLICRHCGSVTEIEDRQSQRRCIMLPNAKVSIRVRQSSRSRAPAPHAFI